MIPVYAPGDFLIGFGIPGTPAYAEIENWIDLRVENQSQRFTGSKGILNEPFIEMSGDSSVIYSLTILQASIEAAALHTLFLAQLTGIVGAPFSVVDNGSDSNVTQVRQKTAYPVGIVIDEAEKNLGLEGQGWIFKIWAPYGATLYI